MLTQANLNRLTVPRCRHSTYACQKGFLSCWPESLELVARWT